MAANSDLFDLIKSMSKSEKRYFRIHGAARSEAKYLRMFELIDAQKHFDDGALRAAFGAEFGDRHFSEAKYYLYGAVLRALHGFAAERSVDVRIVRMLHQASILFERKLVRQSEKMLERARELAVRHERWHLAADAIRQGYIIAKRTGTDLVWVQAAVDTIGEYIELWRLQHEHWATYALLLMRMRSQGVARSPDELSVFVAAMDGRGLSEREREVAPTNRLYHQYGVALCQEAGGDYAGAVRTYAEMLSVAQASPAWRDEPNLMIAPILCEISRLSISAGDLESFHRYHAMLLECAERSPASVHFEARLIALACLPGVYVGMGRYHEALQAAGPLEEAIASARASGHVDVHRTSSPALLLISIHFGLGNYGRCVDYVNMLLDMVPLGLPPHQYGLTKIMQLMVHFERGDYDLLEHLLRSAHRYFIANGAGYRAEEAILGFIKRALRSGGGADHDALFRWLLREIEPLMADRFESEFLYYLDLVPWLLSRIEGRPFAELVRASFATRSEPRASVNPVNA